MAEDVNLDKPFDGLERHAGDLITADDWNQIQIETKRFLWSNVGVIKEKSTLSLGNLEASGNVYLFPKGTTPPESLDKAAIHIDGEKADLHLGGPGSKLHGDLYVYANKETCSEPRKAAIRLNGGSANIRLGGADCGNGGDIYLYPSTADSASDSESPNKATIHIDGERANMQLGGSYCVNGGDIFLHSSTSDSTLYLNASIALGGEYADLVMGGLNTALRKNAAGEDVGNGGTICLFAENVPTYADFGGTLKRASKYASIYLEGANGSIHMGGKQTSNPGRVYLYANDVDNCIINHSPTIPGSSTLDFIDANASITLDGQRASLWIGGPKKDGSLYLMSKGEYDKLGKENAAIKLEASSSSLSCHTIQATELTVSSAETPSYESASIYLDGEHGDVRLGGHGTDTEGSIFLFPSKSTYKEGESWRYSSIALSANAAKLRLGGRKAKSGLTDPDLSQPAGSNSRIELYSDQVAYTDNAWNASIVLGGNYADLIMGGKNTCQNPDGTLGQGGTICLFSSNTETYSRLSEGSDPQRTSKHASIYLEGNQGSIFLGGQPTRKAGKIYLFSSNVSNCKTIEDGSGSLKQVHIPENASICINGEEASLDLGGKPGKGGILRLKSSKSATDASIIIDSENNKITGSGDTIISGVKIINASGGDCAEEFDILSTSAIEPGTVMVIAEDEKLRKSDQPYDRKVAGVIAGAGGYHPALILDSQKSLSERLPLSLIGKVYCKADASVEAIEAGDLLTTSNNPGHAMKAVDPSRVFGAVLGKALEPLAQGETGLIAILVTLQ